MAPLGSFVIVKEDQGLIAVYGSPMGGTKFQGYVSTVILADARRVSDGIVSGWLSSYGLGPSHTVDMPSTIAQRLCPGFDGVDPGFVGTFEDGDIVELNEVHLTDAPFGFVSVEPREGTK